MLESTNTTFSAKGMKAHEMKLSEKVSKGANIKTSVLDVEGNIVSFTTNFKASAKGCIKPKTPTTFGPLLLCIPPIILRSNKVKKATVIKIGTNIHKHFKIKKIIKIKLNIYSPYKNLIIQTK